PPRGSPGPSTPAPRTAWWRSTRRAGTSLGSRPPPAPPPPPPGRSGRSPTPSRPASPDMRWARAWPPATPTWTRPRCWMGPPLRPTAWPLGAVDDTELTRRTGHALGAILAAGDIDLDLAPVLDVSTDPANPVIGTRAFGDDPDRVAHRARAFASGLTEAGLGSC